MSSRLIRSYACSAANHHRVLRSNRRSGVRGSQSVVCFAGSRPETIRDDACKAKPRSPFVPSGMPPASTTSSASNLYAATRTELQRDFESATNLPDRPDC